ncbi:unnamed protein product [Durusdinium trenchii]|uniref:MATH domain-containing protein n=1 Tax=Durusdinium trenchii TaxID=1381693 RepID=A0ABP0L246_9DINO
MPKKPVLVTLEEFQDLKTQLESQIAGVQKELRAKVHACDTHIAELEVAKKELAQGLDVAKEATKRVAEDAQAHTTSRYDGLEQRSAAQLGQLRVELKAADEELQRQLTALEAELRALVAEELKVLCDRVDEELALVREEVEEAVKGCYDHSRVELQKLCELLAKSIDENKQEMLVTTTEAVKEVKDLIQKLAEKEQQARSVEEERFQLSEAEIWLKIGRLQELIDESATQADFLQTTREIDSKFSQAMDLADGRLRALEDTSIRLRSGLCEVQNVPTRRVTWVIREASKKIRKPLLDDVKIQPHVSWFSPLFDAGGCHGLQLELQVFRSMDPPVEGQEAGDCAACLWATKGSNLVFKLGVGSRWQLLEKRFNGRVPYGTTRLCFFVDQINREDDTLSVSCEILEVLRELEAPLQPAAPQPPDWRKALEEQGKEVPEVDPAIARVREDPPLSLEGQLFYSMHINNRLYDQVKEQVDSMRCRLVKTVEWKIDKASMLRPCFPPGEALCSTDFGAAGIEGLHLLFYPCGYTGATDGYCSLFVSAPAGAMMKCVLYAGKERRDANHTFERPGAFGRTNFCQFETCVEDDSILIRLDITEAHQDVVAKVASAPPKPGELRTLSQLEGVVSSPVQSAVKLRRQHSTLEDIKVLPSLWTAKNADDPLARPQGYHDFNEFQDRVAQAAVLPVGSPGAALPRTGALVRGKRTDRLDARPRTAGRLSRRCESQPGLEAIDSALDSAELRGPLCWPQFQVQGLCNGVPVVPGTLGRVAEAANG